MGEVSGAGCLTVWQHPREVHLRKWMGNEMDYVKAHRERVTVWRHAQENFLMRNGLVDQTGRPAYNHGAESKHWQNSIKTGFQSTARMDFKPPPRTGRVATNPDLLDPRMACPRHRQSDTTREDRLARMAQKAASKVSATKQKLHGSSNRSAKSAVASATKAADDAQHLLQQEQQRVQRRKDALVTVKSNSSQASSRSTVPAYPQVYYE